MIGIAKQANEPLQNRKVDSTHPSIDTQPEGPMSFHELDGRDVTDSNSGPVGDTAGASTQTPTSSGLHHTQRSLPRLSLPGLPDSAFTTIASVFYNDGGRKDVILLASLSKHLNKLVTSHFLLACPGFQRIPNTSTIDVFVDVRRPPNPVTDPLSLNLHLLSIAFWIKGVKRIQYRFGMPFYDAIRDMGHIAHFIARLQPVHPIDELLLDFCYIDFATRPARPGSTTIPEEVDLRKWDLVLTDLLETARSQGVRDLRVVSGHTLPELLYGHRAYPEQRALARPSIKRWSKYDQSLPAASPTRVSRLAYRGLKTPSGPPSLKSLEPSSVPIHRLSTIQFDCPFFFVPKNLFRSIEFIKRWPSDITSLSLADLTLPAETWAQILAQITLPNLTRFAIRSRKIIYVLGTTVGDLLMFLWRHKSIEELDVFGMQLPFEAEDTTEFRNFVPPSDAVLLPNLRRLSAHPEYIAYILPSHVRAMQRNRQEPIGLAPAPTLAATVARRPTPRKPALFSRLSQFVSPRLRVPDGSNPASKVAPQVAQPPLPRPSTPVSSGLSNWSSPLRSVTINFEEYSPYYSSPYRRPTASAEVRNAFRAMSQFPRPPPPPSVPSQARRQADIYEGLELCFKLPGRSEDWVWTITEGRRSAHPPSPGPTVAPLKTHNATTRELISNSNSITKVTLDCGRFAQHLSSFVETAFPAFLNIFPPAVLREVVVTNVGTYPMSEHLLKRMFEAKCQGVGRFTVQGVEAFVFTALPREVGRGKPEDAGQHVESNQSGAVDHGQAVER